MAERIDLYWRVCATGLCFSSFGIGGLLLRVLVFPLLRLAVWHEQRRAAFARWLIHHAFRFFVGLMCRLGVISYEVRGRHKLRRRGLLILANHPTLIDVVFLMSFIKHADCIVKAALAGNPFTRGPVRAAGFVCNDSGPGMVHDCIASLHAGNNLIVFPEGTRTPRDGAARLQRGAANVAVRGGIAVTPVRIRVTPPTLGKGEKWYRVPARRAHFIFDVGDDIDVRRFTEPGGSEAIAARRLTEHLAEHFSPETLSAPA
jgi:1-acyl-sn-glycerol-3-phosphate acyltransferase